MSSSSDSNGLPKSPSAQTALVTGPTRGLGKEATLHLASLGTRLILLGRPSPAFDAIAAESRSRGAVVEQVGTDFESLASVRSAIESVKRLVDRSGPLAGGIDAVVANAGLQMTDRVHVTVDGLETTFAVNVIANHLLLSGLGDALNPAAHVVIVGSGTHFGQFPATLLVAAPTWTSASVLARPGGADETKARSGQTAYSTSKLAVNYMVNEFQRRDTRGVRYNVFDPGLMPGTGLARDMPAYKQWVWHKVMPKMTFVPGTSTPANSGRLLARLAVGLDHAGLRAGYVEIDKATKASDASFNVQREADLFAVCDEITKG